MAKTDVMSVREIKWQDSLAPLKQKYDAAMKAGQQATALILDFASDYYIAYTEANAMGGRDEQRKKRVERLHETIGVEDMSDSWISNLRSIGKEASWLRKHTAQLPRSTDSLKLLAGAGENKSVALITKGTIGSLSSITETRAALGKKPRHYVKQSATYDGSLSFSSQADAVRVFADALTTTDATLSVSDKNMAGALAKHFDKQSWKKVESRVKVKA